jgi:hypothetical protein
MSLRDKLEHDFNMTGHPILSLRNRMLLQIYEKMNRRLKQNIQSGVAFNVHLTLELSISYKVEDKVHECIFLQSRT